jgi:hypothetical protein
MTIQPAKYTLSHIRYLEVESIHVLREVAAEFERPVRPFVPEVARALEAARGVLWEIETPACRRD